MQSLSVATCLKNVMTYKQKCCVIFYLLFYCIYTHIYIFFTMQCVCPSLLKVSQRLDKCYSYVGIRYLVVISYKFHTWRNIVAVNMRSWRQICCYAFCLTKSVFNFSTWVTTGLQHLSTLTSMEIIRFLQSVYEKNKHRKTLHEIFQLLFTYVTLCGL